MLEGLEEDTMKNHIQIKEEEQQIKLTIYQEKEKNSWEKIIQTTKPEILKDFIKEIRYQIDSFHLNNEDLAIVLKDKNTVIIKNYQKIQRNPFIKPLTSMIQRKNNGSIKVKFARAALISFSAFVGLSGLGRKVGRVNAEALKTNTSLESLEDLEEITVIDPENLVEVKVEDQIENISSELIEEEQRTKEQSIEQENQISEEENTKEEDIKEEDTSNLMINPETPSIIEIDLTEEELEDDLAELDSAMEEEQIESQSESNETPLEEALSAAVTNTKEATSIKNAIPAFGEEDKDEKRSFVHENYGDIVQKYADISGIDSAVIECILAQERGEHSSEIEVHGAIGVAQVQYNVHVNQERSLYNVQTGETETFLVTDAMLRDLEGNIKVGVAILQTYLQQYNGNIFLAVQSYNYGTGAVDTALNQAAARTGISKEEMINNPECLVWIEDIKAYKDGTFGDPNFLENVFVRYTDEDLTIKYNQEPTESEIPVKEKSL